MIAELLLMLALVPTDQTVNVAKGTKLDVNNFAGDVLVKVWDRDAVRVEATHSDRETIDIKPGDQVLSIRSRSTRGGPPRSLDYALTIPKWMAISVSGTYADVTMDAVGGDVTVDTTRGDIKVIGGSGFISLKSVQGEITLEKAKGRVEVRAVNEGIHLADINADLSAESTNGSILLDRIDSSNVDLYTVNGNISYDGAIKDKGLYRLTTHNGLIAMPIAERANAIVTLRTYNGGIRSTFQLPGDTAERRKRQTLTLGNGSAHVELESFSGTIALRRPGEARPEIERKRRDRDKEKEKEKEIGPAMADIQIDIDRVIADVQPEIDAAMAQVQPEIDRAMAEAMREMPSVRVDPIPMPMPMPHVHPAPRPR
jgi:putative adhesin